MRNPVSHFAKSISDVNIRRSSFDMNHRRLFTMSAGLLYPCYDQEVIPGDTFKIDTSILCRMSTPIHPVMDDCYMDVYFYFVPNRIVWDHWKQFMGEPEDDPYLTSSEYSVPQLRFHPSGGSDSGSLIGASIPFKSVLDYMGVPPGTTVPSVNALKFRGFGKIWNEWFRDQNLMNAIDVPTGDADEYMAIYSSTAPSSSFHFWDSNNSSNPDAYVTNCCHGGDLPPVSKFHDYFTSALREPQKGDPVSIPLNGFAPVYASELFSMSNFNVDSESNPILVDYAGDPISGYVGGNLGSLESTGTAVSNLNKQVFFDNLVVDLGLHKQTSNSMNAAYSTISDLRYAFQMQKFLEADNRGGTRYRELIYNHFNVTAPDTEMQIPEFLGGKRIHINMNQVIQTSSTDDVSPQGNTAAYSLTTDRSSSFTKSFTEHGYIIGVCCIRTAHSYAQGINKSDLRRDRFDYYWPEFANISEQPIRNVEIYSPYSDDNPGLDYDYNGIFGYQEAWAEYRYKPNTVHGEFRPTYPQSLDSWHYGDYYTSQPFLSSEWVRETRSNIDRTLAVSSELADQFICDFAFHINATRPLPMYSIPGLADHH